MMATSEIGTEMSGDLDIEALINAEMDENDVTAVVSSIHQELNSTKDGALSLSQDSGFVSIESTPSDIESQNCSQDNTQNSTDASQPVKTKGEASSASLTSISHNLTLNLSSTPLSTSAKAGSLPLDGSNRRPSLTSLSPFGGITPQTPNTQLLTSDEQSALYKQASLFAIQALVSKSGQAKAKEMLNVVTKVKNFLTNLIQLAGNSGPSVKTAVHSLVQKLVAGSITEEEFAKKIEEDLKSKHQPGLLPFLKNSVHDLRLHLQLQKEYMRQLVEKKVQEKQAQQTITDQSTPKQETPSKPQTQTLIPSITSNTITTTQKPIPTTQSQPQTTLEQTPTSTILLQQVARNAANIVTNPLLTLTIQQQQAIRLQLAKLPEEQRKVYLEQLNKQRQLQLQLALQKQKNNKTQLASGGVTTPLLTTTPTTPQQLSVLLKQQQLMKEQKQQASLALANQSSLTVQGQGSPKRGTSPSPRKGLNSLLNKVKTSKDDDNFVGGKTQVQEDDDEEESMDIAGINLKEETAHFLPTAVVDTTSRSCSDETFISPTVLRDRVQRTAHRYGVTDMSEEYLSFLSHATEERLKNIFEKVILISQHRVETLKDDSHYETTSDVRGQLKVLERIDEISASRRQEREKEKIIRAAKSRSKQDDPELAKMKEQAKQLQLEQEREIHQRAANETALAAIGRRKRTATTAFGGENSSLSGSGANESTDGSGLMPQSSAAAVFSTPNTSRTKQKRRIQVKDVVLTMEQEKETRHSLLLYKSYLS